MQQNGEVDGFFSIVSPPVTSPNLVLIVDSRNGNRFLQGSESFRASNACRSSCCERRPSKTSATRHLPNGKPVKIILVTKSPDCSLLTTFPPAFCSHHAFQVSREQITGTFPSPNVA